MMSPMRQPPRVPTDLGPEPDVRAFAATPAAGSVVLPQPAGWDQLLYATVGVMTVITAAGTWVVPPQRAVWVPSGLDHHIELAGEVRMRSLYFGVHLGGGPGVCRAVNVPPLVLEAARRAPLFLEDTSDERLIGLLLEQVDALPAAPLQLPRPVDPRAAEVAAALWGDAAASLDLAAVCAAAGASRRTVERLFRQETGLGLAEWRTRRRMVEAVRLLAEGGSATSVALAVGYATPSAFGAAFRRTLGASPGRYFQRRI
jgi:AraC-like DNA-binding protein